MKKRAVGFLAVLVLMSLLASPAHAHFEMRADEAIAWVHSLPEGQGYEADNAIGGEALNSCVDLIVGYIMHIRGTASSGTSGYAKDYVYNELPPGFTRYSRYETTVQKGDILVWNTDDTGHVAICTAIGSAGEIIFSDQNGYDRANNVSYAHKVKHNQQIVSANDDYWGVIRPDFNTYTPQEMQIMANAQEILDQYANMNEYINWLANQQLYYRRTLNDAECYRGAYTSIMSYGTALADVGIHVLTGDALSTVRKAAENTVRGELNCYLPEMTTEQFIYSQARMGADDIERSALFDIQDKLVDGKFTDPKNAAEFLRIYQKNKAGFAAAEMGRQYYYNELNKSAWDHLGSLFTSVATCQVSGLFQDTLSDSDLNALADQLFNMMGIVSDCYDNEYVDAWMARLREIERETENLFAWELADASGSGSGSAPAATVTVSFDAAGGSVGLASREYAQNAALGYLPAAFRFGYDFLGWYDASGARYTENSAVGASLTLYARWSRIILDSGSCGDDLTYALYGDGLLEFFGSGSMTSAPWTNYAGRVGEVSLPEGLTSLANSAFSGCKYLHEIVLPSTVKRIYNSAFANTGLQSLTLPNGVEELGYNILSGNTGVKELTVPGSVSSMGTYYSYNGTFTGSALEKVIFKEGFTKLGTMAFKGVTTLTQVQLPGTLTTINDNAFYGCTNLTTIYYHGTQEAWNAVTVSSGNDQLQSVTVYCLPALSAPDCILPAALTEIKEEAFRFSAASWAVLPEGIASIGPYAFADCENLSRIDIPVASVEIDADAFTNSPKLTIAAPAGGSVERFAAEHGIPFFALSPAA